MVRREEEIGFVAKRKRINFFRSFGESGAQRIDFGSDWM
jgi:hypothetical protein